MTETIENKMYLIAKYLGELNDDGNVKGFKGNENGYAKVLEIKRGCALWVHHLKEDRLIIDLMITDTAGSKYPELSRKAVEQFKNFFNYMSGDVPWTHSMKTINAERYYVDITDLKIEEIKKVIDKLKSEFKNVLL